MGRIEEGGLQLRGGLRKGGCLRYTGRSLVSKFEVKYNHPYSTRP